MEKLGNYTLDASLTNQNAGYSVWGFGKRDGKEYFIKQFVEQKYPHNDTVSSPERLQKKIRACERFEQRKTALYQALNQYSDGNAVRVEEFFRVESKYYISMQKIHAFNWGVADITALPKAQIRQMCAIIAHGVAMLHQGHLIHADLKPDNILFTKTSSNFVTAKIIDFDSGFLESDPPGPGEAIVGDFHYFSPEACLSIWGEEIPLTCKMDIFALGVLFHQYFTGELPGFDQEQSSYSGEAAAKGEALQVSAKLPADIRQLLQAMLQREPEHRPTAMEVFATLRGLKAVPKVTEVKPEVDMPPPMREDPIAESTKSANPFFRPGDL